MFNFVILLHATCIPHSAASPAYVFADVNPERSYEFVVSLLEPAAQARLVVDLYKLMVGSSESVYVKRLSSGAVGEANGAICSVGFLSSIYGGFRNVVLMPPEKARVCFPKPVQVGGCAAGDHTGVVMTTLPGCTPAPRIVLDLGRQVSGRRASTYDLDAKLLAWCEDSECCASHIAKAGIAPATNFCVLTVMLAAAFLLKLAPNTASFELVEPPLEPAEREIVTIIKSLSRQGAGLYVHLFSCHVLYYFVCLRSH